MPFSEKQWDDIFRGNYEGGVVFSEPMKGHTGLEIGGTADIMATPRDPLSMRNLVVELWKRGVPFFTLGWGTNILVLDSGIEGLVISLKAFRRIEVLREDSKWAELFVEAGVPLQGLVNFCRERGYSGVEGLTGIPGTVGGAIYGNAGSYGYEMKDVLVSLAILDQRGVLDRFRPEGLEFGYRQSGIPATEIVLSANLRLRRDDRDAVSLRTEGFFLRKKHTQPISEKSAGCVFKNPEGESAGRLIDGAGCKGLRRGNIEVSTMHANFFINRGGGTASDYLSLMEEVSSAVRAKFSILLEPEIRIVGRA